MYLPVSFIIRTVFNSEFFDRFYNAFAVVIHDLSQRKKATVIAQSDAGLLREAIACLFLIYTVSVHSELGKKAIQIYFWNL